MKKTNLLLILLILLVISGCDNRNDNSKDETEESTNIADCGTTPYTDNYGIDLKNIFESEEVINEIYEKLGKEENITTNDLDGITVLDLEDKVVESIQGIETLKNLKTLNLKNSNTVDLRPLEQLDKLEILYVNDDFINPSFIPIIENLDSLYIVSNMETEVSEEVLIKFSEIKSIRYLYVAHSVRNKNQIFRFTNLDTLVLYDEIGEDLNQLQELTNLKELKLYGNGFDVTKLTKIEKLTLKGDPEYYQIDNIEGYNVLLKLKYLDIQGNEVKNISSLLGLKDLKYLDISENPLDIKNIKNIVPHLDNLEILYMRFLKLQDITFLSQLNNISELYLDFNGITDLSPLENLNNLEVLSIMYNNVENLASLAKTESLKMLYLTGNPINDYSAIDDLNLEEIEK